MIFQNFGSKEALYAAVLDRVAHSILGELQAQADQHGTAAEVLAHVLSPSRASGRHGPGSHGPGPHEMLFGDAATLLADPGLTESPRSVARSLAGHLADRRARAASLMPGSFGYFPCG